MFEEFAWPPDYMIVKQTEDNLFEGEKDIDT